MSQKLVLAYSGGLDTSVAIHWLAERDYEVLALAIDLGEAKDLDAVMDRALKHGATKAFMVDARDLFLRHFVWPTLQAGALYEGHYPLATALGRPLIAKLMVDLAREEGATAVAHGCTGKGNDQVRFDVATGALAPDLEVVAPVREWGMTREEEIRSRRPTSSPGPRRPSRPPPSPPMSRSSSSGESLWVSTARSSSPWSWSRG